MADQPNALPIVPGFEHGLRLTIVGQDAFFPFGCRLRAPLREFFGARFPLTELTTGVEIERVDDNTIDMRIPAEITARIGNTSVVVELVRTDVAPEVYLYVMIQIPVVQSAGGVLGSGTITQHFPVPFVVTVPVEATATLSALGVRPPPGSIKTVSIARIPSSSTVRAPILSAEAAIAMPRIPSSAILRAPRAAPDLVAIYMPLIEAGVGPRIPKVEELEPALRTVFAARIDPASVLFAPVVSAEPAEVRPAAIPSGSVARAPRVSPGVVVVELPLLRSDGGIPEPRVGIIDTNATGFLRGMKMGRVFPTTYLFTSGASSGGGAPSIPANALTLNGQVLTLNGQILTLN